ncbi:MAG: hypothetical protein HQ592_03805 [Planctomycetes bacterium]|nr:hypothetical protein [Planctomycetota bacterium]
MIKYVCDMCGKPLIDNEDVRYVVRIDVYAACESAEYPEGYDDLDAVEDMLDAADDPDGPRPVDESFSSFRFDLCSICHRRYLEDPLSVRKERRLGFSDN